MLSLLRWKKIIYASGDKKRTGTAKFVSDKIDMKPEMISREKNIII